MRISDWSSDVCSSDLLIVFQALTAQQPLADLIPENAIGVDANGVLHEMLHDLEARMREERGQFREIPFATVEAVTRPSRVAAAQCIALWRREENVACGRNPGLEIGQQNLGVRDRKSEE